MLLPNSGVDSDRLLGLVAKDYRGAGATMEFVPLGEDSWCYRTGTLWVSVRRDERGHWPSAYELAHRLHSDGWKFVLAPLAGSDGRVVREFDGYPVVVFPFLEVSQLADREISPMDLAEVSGLLRQLHDAVVPNTVGTEDFQLGFLAELDRALGQALDRQWCSGPLSWPLRACLKANASHIAQIRREIAEVAHACRSAGNHFVLTHGEPSTANLLVHQDKLMLGDWGGAMWGPPERDWFHLARTASRRLDGRAEFFRYYELRWALSEITEYVVKLTQPHSGNADDRAMWQRLQRYLSN